MFDFSNNNLIELDTSQNLNVFSIRCSRNNITELDISNNQELTVLQCHYNNLSQLDISPVPGLSGLICSGNNITSLDLSQNPSLFTLYCGSNEIEDIDLSQNSNLKIFSSRSMETLTYLDLRNGNNGYITTLWITDTPNLNCILVDDAIYANSQGCNYPIDGWCKDTSDIYIEDINDCELGIDNAELSSKINIYPNPVKNILKIDNSNNYKISSIKIYDVLGRLVLSENENFRQVDVSNLASGLLFVYIETNEGVFTKKIIKE